ncbi:hypothetical protein [Massilia sp. X63]|uniref:hypothetical protein n=1 Tax=Massilia sp. X63 TaxID=3237285 RepID=UPI0034DDA2F9
MTIEEISAASAVIKSGTINHWNAKEHEKDPYSLQHTVFRQLSLGANSLPEHWKPAKLLQREWHKFQYDPDWKQFVHQF